MNAVSDLSGQDLLDFMRFHLVYDGKAGTLTWRVDSEFGTAGESAVRLVIGVGLYAYEKPRIAFGSSVFEAADLCYLLKTGTWPLYGCESKSRHDGGNLNLKISNIVLRNREPIKKSVVVKVDYTLLQRIYDDMSPGTARDEVQGLLVRWK